MTNDKRTISKAAPFQTSDTAMAAYMMSSGCGVPEIIVDENENKAWMLFPRDTPQQAEKLEQCVSDWDSTLAVGNIRGYFNSYQALLRRIREKLNA